jgi:hypothetical protein
MTPISLSDIKKFPHILRELIEDLHEYPHLDNNPCLEECVSKLNEIYFLDEPFISSFCAGITEATITDELAEIPLSMLNFILRNCNSIRKSMNSNLSDEIIRNIDDIMPKFKFLESHLGVEFFSSYSDSLLKSYHVMAKEIKKDAIANASTSGKIMANIQKSINEVNRSDSVIAFNVVVGPTLMGKTQLAFTLALDQPIIYINFASKNDESAYDAFSHISNEFKKLLKADFEIFSRFEMDESGKSKHEIRFNNLKYWTFGFLLAIYRISSAVTFNDQFNWMSFYVKLKSFVFQRISTDTFIREIRNILLFKLSKLLIFNA